MAARDYPEMLALVASGALKPETLITREVDLTEGAKALAELEGQPFGGITVITPGR